MATLPALPGCDDSVSYRTNPADLGKNVATQKWSDLGEGVFTFEFGGFAKSLVDFKKGHPDLVITSIYADKEGGYGGTQSVVVNTEPRSTFQAAGTTQPANPE